jgi:ABC-type Fe3+/spermidine/putrescine transport system ATPase subunit
VSPIALALGADVHVAIRPEDIEVDGARADGGTLPGVIDTLLFVGDRYETCVRLGGDQRIVLLLPRTREWKEGQAISLAFPPDTVSVWPA